MRRKRFAQQRMREDGEKRVTQAENRTCRCYCFTRYPPARLGRMDGTPASRGAEVERYLSREVESGHTENVMPITEHSQATLTDYLAVFRRRGLLILATTLLVAGVAHFVSRQVTKI